MNETEPPVQSESGAAETDGSPAVASSDPVKPRSAILGAMLFCVNLALVATLFIAHMTLTGRGPASGRASSVPSAPVGATATSTDTALPPDETPPVDATPTATPVRVAAQPTATTVTPAPTSTPTPAIAPTPTPTIPPPTPTVNPGA